ncbi:MAG TPA: D-aminoacylase [Terracidiphilus sp.]|nr:D-aminoacylase [Terracidiphilus sp.]
MLSCDTLIRNASVLDGSGASPELQDVAVQDGVICAIGPSLDSKAANETDAAGLALAPGFIDVHTHDDLAVIQNPGMLPKLSQGVTTVIVGNCGISASPVTPRRDLPDPMNLLGAAGAFQYPHFADYKAALQKAQPAVNVGVLIGHTALRNNHLDRLDRAATPGEIEAMRNQLQDALNGGALGLSTGLAYLSANAASFDEVVGLAEVLAPAAGVYTTHMRTEAEGILSAMREAFEVGRLNKVPVVVSHLKCSGIDNWGRSGEVLRALESAQQSQQAGCDCYPYAASSSTLDLRQVDERVEIMITWSDPHPQMAGRKLAEIASEWKMTQLDAARRLCPAGAIYHSMSEADMRRILTHPATMIGSDGLPNDPRPHPRLWGTFPRVLGHFTRDEGLLSLPAAVLKMTGMPAQRFGLSGRGYVRTGYAADMVLFDPATIADTATFSNPIRAAKGIEAVWVNGVLSYTSKGGTGKRAGEFVPRGKTNWIQ